MSKQLAPLQQEFLLTSPGGLKLRAIPWGATVTHLWAPDRNGHLADVVLGFSDDNNYHQPHPYFGAMAGRVAGRISNAQFHLNNKTYPLAPNDAPNHLHGGIHGFDKQRWQAQQPDAQTLRFHRTSPDGEEGYPGRVEVAVTYSLSNTTFAVDVEATTTAPTPFTLTHHSYFNLAGEGSRESIESHELEIFADDFAAADNHMGLTGKRESVSAGNDFRRRRLLAEAIPQLHARHGDLYFIGGDPSPTDITLAARLTHAPSGRVMTVYTSEPCLQLYTGVGLDGSLIGKSGTPYTSHAGLCLECEKYPDGANTPALGNIILYPGQKAFQRTLYTFSTV